MNTVYFGTVLSRPVVAVLRKRGKKILGVLLD